MAALPAQTAQESVKTEATESTHDKAVELAADFTMDGTSGYGKRLETAYEGNPSDPELSALYNYWNARFMDDWYGGEEGKGKAKNEMSKISSDYSGVMAAEISKYAVGLFGSLDAWGGNVTKKAETSATLTSSKKAEIKKWIEDRYSYYDLIEGDYAGDKYTDTIFSEAAKKYGLTLAEVDEIWFSLN
jgi:hypothetical protein